MKIWKVVKFQKGYGIVESDGLEQPCFKTLAEAKAFRQNLINHEEIFTMGQENLCICAGGFVSGLKQLYWRDFHWFKRETAMSFSLYRSLYDIYEEAVEKSMITRNGIGKNSLLTVFASAKDGGKIYQCNNHTEGDWEIVGEIFQRYAEDGSFLTESPSGEVVGIYKGGFAIDGNIVTEDRTAPLEELDKEAFAWQEEGEFEGSPIREISLKDIHEQAIKKGFIGNDDLLTVFHTSPTSGVIYKYDKGWIKAGETNGYC